MKAMQVEVYAEDGLIYIQQDDPYGEPPQTVAITPEQAEQFCNWVMQTQFELVASKNEKKV